MRSDVDRDITTDREAARRREDGIGRGKTIAVLTTIVVIVVIVDQVTKAIARGALSLGHPVTAIPGLFDFELIYNRGAAFGIMQDATMYFVIMAVIIVVAIVFYLLKGHPSSTFEVVALSMVASGAIGNAIDRAFRSGTVTDFIATSFMSFPVFNVADIAVTLGCLFFIISLLLISRDEHRSSKTSAERGSDDGDGKI